MTLGGKGASGINAASVLRKVDITVARGDIVHKVCRKKFIDKNYIYTSKVCGQLKLVLRKELTFNHRADCFLCGTEVVINEKHDDGRPKSYLVQNKEISMPMVKYCDR